ncbi:protein nrt1/ ptr family 8.2 [Phtheirospermum japonicum]|uniref:Protein nrt1/ ptr family 8.2 n=1 Tax=Phtheirospermum japonicum TaxID=374723 RepID=A0A830CYK9_9LAMI|nr:protein nrt1/ ptr family 8.2 [Phtheirospermum japonicum]
MLPPSSQTAICFIALYLVALGTGGIKPCISSYGADQFDDAGEIEKSHKSSFNWFYFSINAGTSITSSVLVYIQVNVGWGWGFGVSAVAMAISIASSFRALSCTITKTGGGSPLTCLCLVAVASVRKYRVKVPNDKSLVHKTSDAQLSTIIGSLS